MLARLFHYLQIIYKNLIHIPGKDIAQHILAAEYFSIPNFLQLPDGGSMTNLLRTKKLPHFGVIKTVVKCGLMWLAKKFHVNLLFHLF